MRVEYCKEAYEDFEDEDYEDLSEMANVTTVDSGLPFPVWKSKLTTAEFPV